MIIETIVQSKEEENRALVVYVHRECCLRHYPEIKNYILAAEHRAQWTGLDAYTYEELAKEIVRRGYEVAITPRRSRKPPVCQLVAKVERT